MLVHAYLMYGFPTQTVHDTVDALEYVRQLFEAGCIQSGFFHRFACTVHSPVGMNPDEYGIRLIPCPAAVSRRTTSDSSTLAASTTMRSARRSTRRYTTTCMASGSISTFASGSAASSPGHGSPATSSSGRSARTIRAATGKPEHHARAGPPPPAIPNYTAPMDSFALLEDRLTDRSLPSSRLYTGFSHERRCDHASKLEAFWKDVETDLACGLHAVVLIDYEWGVQLQLEAPDATATCTDSALTVLLFRNLELLDSARCNAVLEGAASGGVLRATPDVTHADFDAAIEAIHAAIREGETYQINYTYRLKVLAYGEPLALYRRLRARQVVAYGAFIRLPAAAASISHVLSFSPELFLKKTGAQLEARPMKGTAALTGGADLDSQAAAALAADEKNRAENLMIVDLLRNDLGRICKTGSIRVPSLFSVEQYETLLQMTSTVTGELQPGTGFPAVLRALFPCGSITGAPKHRSMQIIDRLEASPRGLTRVPSDGWTHRATAPAAAISASRWRSAR